MHLRCTICAWIHTSCGCTTPSADVLLPMYRYTVSVTYGSELHYTTSTYSILHLVYLWYACACVRMHCMCICRCISSTHYLHMVCMDTLPMGCMDALLLHHRCSHAMCCVSGTTHTVYTTSKGPLHAPCRVRIHRMLTHVAADALRCTSHLWIYHSWYPLRVSTPPHPCNTCCACR